MAQYDSIGALYDVFDTLPYRKMEVFNVRSALDSFSLPNMTVLDMACGTGSYSSRLLQWGVKSLTGVDISSVMATLASSNLEQHVLEGRARFLVADGREPQSFAPNGELGFYDLAFGAWFLNYARSKEQLVRMFETVALNLRPGGVFIGVVPHPTDEVDRRAAEYSKPPRRKFIPRNEYTQKLPHSDGWGLRVYLGQGVDITTWHLRQSVYEDAAREGGLKGRLEWRREVLLDDEWRDNHEPKLSACEWKFREENPHMGILLVFKD